MNSKRKWLGISAALLFITLICGVVLLHPWDSSIETRFPIWEEAGQFENNPDVKLELAGIDFDVSSSDEFLLDEISVTLTNLTDHDVHYGKAFHVDFLHDGKWYTVCRPGPFPAMSISLNGHQEKTETYNVLAGLFRETGYYRICIDSLGYCEIDMMLGSH